MACLLRRIAPCVLLCALACGDDRLPDDAGVDGSRDQGDGDATADAGGDGDAAPPAPFDAGFAGPADASAGDDAGQGTALPEPEVGDGWLRFSSIEANPQSALVFEIDVPAEADAMVVTIDPGDTPRSIALVELTGPAGDVLYDLRDEEIEFPYRPTLLRNVNDHLPYAFMVPTNAARALHPGRYRVLAFVEDPSEPVDVDVVFQFLPGSSVQPHLGIVLWFAAGASVDAQTASTDPDFIDAVDGMVAIFRAVGIRIDDVQYGNLANDPALANVSGDAELAQLVGQLRGDPEQVLHFIFVDHLENEAGSTVRGRASGLPGPPSHPDLARRGAVVIPLDALPASIRRTGEVFAHEAAHYLGLAHTTEVDGVRHDPIEDTPECPAELASEVLPSGEVIPIPADCADYDGYNLMFYTQPLSGLDQRELSEHQAVILAVNPMVRWVPR